MTKFDHRRNESVIRLLYFLLKKAFLKSRDVVLFPRPLVHYTQKRAMYLETIAVERTISTCVGPAYLCILSGLMDWAIAPFFPLLADYDRWWEESITSTEQVTYLMYTREEVQARIAEHQIYLSYIIVCCSLLALIVTYVIEPRQKSWAYDLRVSPLITLAAAAAADLWHFTWSGPEAAMKADELESFREEFSFLLVIALVVSITFHNASQDIKLS